MPNFHRVDAHVFRGGQPTQEGLRNIARMGIRTVVDLREPAEHAANEKQEVERLGMRYVHVPMRDHKRPTDQEVSQALAILNDKSAWPVFVHCDGGKDRTGVVVACYRIARYHWSNQRALAEAFRDGLSKDGKERYIGNYHAGAEQGSGEAAAASR